MAVLAGRMPKRNRSSPFLVTLLVLAWPVFADEQDWRPTNPENTAVLALGAGAVVIELNTEFAPATVAQFKRLVRKGFYDGLDFYRVIDGFVAQGGDGSDIGKQSDEPTIKAEFERDWSNDLPFAPVQEPDLFAPETGFVNGFAVARESAAGKAWLIHCPGVVAMARGNDADSSRTDFYIVIGQSPRYLDRNLTIFGRVVFGMEHVQRIRRGPPSNNGIIDDAQARSTIRSLRMAADLPSTRRPKVQVRDSNSESFAALLKARRHREADFFHHTPPPVLDVCQVPNSGRVAP
ncbi:MAG: peptidylprolyl isomerase [Xanthomonadales bacterium]|nr:peptidylprolyl isomerase [Xanthomonadales bacterium]